MPKYWMISNRDLTPAGPGQSRGPLKFYVSDTGPLDVFANWQPVPMETFRDQLIQSAEQFPRLSPAQQEEQCHVAFLVHGYNEGWQDAARLYQKVCNRLFSGEESLGLCISFDWPSLGSVLGYYPDRQHARACADDLAEILSQLFDWLVVKQQMAVRAPDKACKAKVSVLSHSMGNYVLQKAMLAAWTRHNQPLLASLINQLVMVAADVDNDLFESDASDGTDGDAMANLSYRITALYSGRDAVLGASAGLKHFGVRRLGRSGLLQDPPTDKDNVWQVDCSGFFPASIGGMSIHSAYFDSDPVYALLHDILRGIDRSVLDTLGRTKGTLWP